MLKYSATYVPFNPNFVISDIPKRNDVIPEIPGITAIIYNILARGVPTKPSLYLENAIGALEIPLNTPLGYTYGIKKNEWDRIIKTGDTSKPALDLYRELCSSSLEMASIILPECNFSDIILNDTSSNEADFYIPSLGLAIEVDGVQHLKSEAEDRERDHRLKKADVETLRFTSMEIKNDTASIVSKLTERIKKSNLCAPCSLNLVTRLYMYVIRFQFLILEFFNKGVISFHDAKFPVKILSEDDDKITQKAFKHAYEDIKLWTNNLFTLLNMSVSFPDVVFTNNAETVIDIDIFSRYDQNFDEQGVIKIRNDYFGYDLYASSDPKLYKNYKNHYKVRVNELRFENVDQNTPKHTESLRFFLENLFFGKGAEFRPNQLDIITNGLSTQKGVIGILPTGSGKSVCYQLISMLTPGITIVVSPLKLLMKDQCDNLNARNKITTALYINSDNHSASGIFQNRQAKLLYISPERLFIPSFKEDFIKLSAAIAHITIDEVHCLSEWGHDFRTSYLLIMSVLKTTLKTEKILLTGTTATASPHVLLDVSVEFSKIKDFDPVVVKSSSIKRPELTFDIQPCTNKFMIIYNLILPLIKKEKTLIFSPTVDKANKLKNYLDGFKIQCGIYTGDSNDFEKNETNKYSKSRSEYFEEFKNGTTKTLVATKAFGMGVDIPDIRKTIHFGLSSSIESLYQEVGRAGRDRKKSTCIILLSDSKNEQLEADKYFNNDTYFIGEAQSTVKLGDDLSNQQYFLEKSRSDYNSFKDFVRYTNKFIRDNNGKDVSLRIAFDSLKNHLGKQLYVPKKIEDPITKSVTYKDVPDYLTFKQFFEKALYKLYVLGLIELWQMQYGSNYKTENIIYKNLINKKASSTEVISNLENHINKYENFKYVPKINKNGKILEHIIETFCKWDNEHFLLYRKNSLYNLYKMLHSFKDSKDFSKRIESFFNDNPLVNEAIRNRDKFSEKAFECLKLSPQSLRDQLARLSENITDNITLNFMIGISSIKIADFGAFEKRALKNSLDKIRYSSPLESETIIEKTIESLKKNSEHMIVFLAFIDEHYKLNSFESEIIKKYAKKFYEYQYAKKLELLLSNIKEKLGDFYE